MLALVLFRNTLEVLNTMSVLRFRLALILNNTLAHVLALKQYSTLLKQCLASNTSCFFFLQNTLRETLKTFNIFLQRTFQTPHEQINHYAVECEAQGLLLMLCGTKSARRDTMTYRLYPPSD